MQNRKCGASATRKQHEKHWQFAQQRDYLSNFVLFGRKLLLKMQGAAPKNESQFYHLFTILKAKTYENLRKKRRNDKTTRLSAT